MSALPSETAVRLIGPPEADGEFIGISSDGGDEEIVHLHDYDRIYAIPGLYERVVQELLQCVSPQVVAVALGRMLDARGLDPGEIRLLDLGAGTGLVGSLVAAVGVGDVTGFDALASARQACLRDRPGVYRDYVVGDLVGGGSELIARLREAYHPNALASAGAFGGTHMPAEALRAAIGLLPAGAPVVFTIDRKWASADGPGGFRGALTDLIDASVLVLDERSEFQHRVTTSGDPIVYELFAGVTGSR